MSGHSQFNLLRQRRFLPFFVTQCLGAFNDNVFRNATIVLITSQLGLDLAQQGLYTNLAPALFILPFFLFSALAGQFAEKYEKTRLIRFVKVFEIVAMAVAAWGFYAHHAALLLVVLFLMGMHSTMFGPIKYSILPQALEPPELVGGNGLVETGTSMAILFGMMLGGGLMLVPGRGPLLASLAVLAIAVVGYLASRAIPPAPATAPDLKINWNVASPKPLRLLRLCTKQRAVFNSILGISWFWFLGTVLTAQLPVYAETNLGGGSALFLLALGVFSVGTGIGSLLCEKLSGRTVEIGLVPLGAFGISAFLFDLYFARPGDALVHGLDLGAFLQAPGSLRVLGDLLGIGVFGGFFLVPLFALVQNRTPRSELSRVIAGNNILNAGFIVAAALSGLAASAWLHMEHPAVLPGAGDRQHDRRDLHLHPGARVPDALPQLGAGAHAVPAEAARHRETRARRGRGAAGLQPRQLHGCADPVGQHPAAGALRHVLQDLQHPGDALDLPHRQGDPDCRCARRPGVDAACVRRGRCGAGRGRAGVHLPGRRVDQGRRDRARSSPAWRRSSNDARCRWCRLALRNMWTSMWSKRDSRLRRMTVPRRLRAHIEVMAAAPVDGHVATAEMLEAKVRALRGDAA